MTDRTRRSVLAALGTTGLGTVAGCVGIGSDSAGGSTSCPSYDPTVSPATGWTTQLGDPRGTGTVPPAAMPGVEPSINWTFGFDTAVGYHTPIVVDGTVYVSDLDTSLWALDSSTGEVRWETGVPEYPSAPAVADGTLVVFGREGVSALDVETGETRWTALDVGGWVLDAHPVIADGTVYAQVGVATYALALSTGEIEWRYATGLGSAVTPAVADGTVFVGGDDTYVRALSADDGTERWRHKTDARIVENVSVAAGRVVAASRDGDVVALDTADGAQRWRHRVPKSGSVHPEPETVTTDGSRVYVVAGRRLHALSIEDGTTCWTHTGVDGSYAASIAVGDGRLYVPTEGSDAQFTTLDPGTGDRLRTWGPADAHFRTGPAVADGAVYACGSPGIARFR